MSGLTGKRSGVLNPNTTRQEIEMNDRILGFGFVPAVLTTALMLFPVAGSTRVDAAPFAGSVETHAASSRSAPSGIVAVPAPGPIEHPIRLAAKAKKQSASEEATAAYLVKDYARAAKLLPPLAEQGKPEAQLMLGDLYASGNGLQADNIAAYKWTYLASTNAKAVADTRDDALKSLDILSRRMSEEDVKTARQQASEWQTGAAPASTEEPPAASTAAEPAPAAERKPEAGRKTARKHHGDRSRRAERPRARAESIIRRYIGSGNVSY
jgi:TPR repeat protein